jgi:hypothetical protein
MNEARMIFEPAAAPAPSALGYAIHGQLMADDLDGALVRIALQTSQGRLELRCIQKWALKFASDIKQCALAFRHRDKV